MHGSCNPWLTQGSIARGAHDSDSIEASGGGLHIEAGHVRLVDDLESIYETNSSETFNPIFILLVLFDLSKKKQFYETIG
jgi:hypothetical protein